VAVYYGHGCHLCERALERVRRLHAELGFELEEVSIDGDAELERRYRELIPVVEIDGEQVFTYYVHDDAFRRRLERHRSTPSGRPVGSDGRTGKPARPDSGAARGA
jgi:glutaredoxin